MSLVRFLRIFGGIVPLLAVSALSKAALSQTAPPPVTAPAAPTPPEGMVYVPAGEFSMGTDNRDPTDFNQRDNTPLNSNDARPRHKATTKAFFIDKTEVTNADYKKFCDATGYPPPPQWLNGQFPVGQDRFPVTRVSWYEATAYSRWAGKRLPTETEWEKAARGTDGRLFPWGNEWRSDCANALPDAVGAQGGPVAVASFPNGASPYGALDMSGNVVEWTASWFEPYPNSPTKQPDFGEKLKVLRGGSWVWGPVAGQTWYRCVSRPQVKLIWTGFRCVKDAP